MGFRTEAADRTDQMTRRRTMADSVGGTGAGTPEDSWRTIHETMDRARSSMYVAGSATILLLWAVIISAANLSQYAVEVFAPEFAMRSPWFRAPLWGGLVTVGMVGSAIIGHRAGKENAVGDMALSAGLKVFLFWISVGVAAFLVPAASGMWNAQPGANIGGVAVGIVSLGYVLFGIMHRPAIAAVGVGIAAAFYIPSHLAGDAALAVSGVAMFVVLIVGAAWIRRSRVL